MMLYRIIKYVTLLGLNFAAVYQVLPVGDYCAGPGSGIAMIMLAVLFLFLIFLFAWYDRFGKRERGKNFDWNLMVLLGVFIISNWIFSSHDPVWTKRVLHGFFFEGGNSHPTSLRLFSNKTFAVSLSAADWNCYCQGDYEVKGDTLIFQRTDLVQKTGGVLSNRYGIDLHDSVLIPLTPGVDTIRIKMWNSFPGEK